MTDAVSAPLVGGLTTTTGTGAFTITSPLPNPAGGNFRQWSDLASGSRTFAYRWASGGTTREEGYVDVTVTGGVASLAWNPRVATSNSGSPVTWSGTQNVVSAHPGVFPANAGAEFGPFASGFRSSIGLDTAAVHPAVRMGFMDAAWMTANSWTGGSNGSVVYRSAPNTLANAVNTLTAAQLSMLGLKTSAGVYFGPSLVTGLTSLTAGTILWLGASAPANLVSTQPAPGGSTWLIRLGITESTTSLFWHPVILEEP